MEDVYRRMAQLLAEGRRFAVATVIATQGSTPRKPGTRMLVLDDGTLVGTIGGGCGEAEAWQESMKVLESGGTTRMTVDMTEEAAAEAGMICGGLMHIFIECIEPKKGGLRKLS